MKTITKDLILLFGLTLACSGIGFGINQLRGNPITLVYRTPAQRLTEPYRTALKKDQIAPTVAQSVEVSREIQILTLVSLQTMKKKDQLLIFDVRPDLFYKLGHIPGARSLQAKDFDTDYARGKSDLKAAIAQGKKIALYCSSSHCPDASTVATALSELGYGNLVVFEAGWEGWQQAGLPEEQSTL